jgi:hypothetical protein
MQKKLTFQKLTCALLNNTQASALTPADLA